MENTPKNWEAPYQKGRLVRYVREIARKYFDIRIEHYVKHNNKTVIHGSKGKDQSKLSGLGVFKHNNI